MDNNDSKKEGERVSGSESLDVTGVSETEEKWYIRQLDKLPAWLRNVLMPFSLFLIMMLTGFAFSIITGADYMGVLETIGVFVTLLTGVFALATWISVQRLRSARPVVPVNTGTGSAILIIDIGKGNIEGNVLTYCKGNELFSDMLNGSGFRDQRIFRDVNQEIEFTGYMINELPAQGRVVHISRANIEDKEIEGSASQIYQAFSWVDKALHKNGISELHVFYAGPVIIPFYLGELFSNRYNIYIYKYLNKDNNKTYTYSGKMNHLDYSPK